MKAIYLNSDNIVIDIKLVESLTVDPCGLMIITDIYCEIGWKYENGTFLPS